jgi:hypothetical protein
MMNRYQRKWREERDRQAQLVGDLRFPPPPNPLQVQMERERQASVWMAQRAVDRQMEEMRDEERRRLDRATRRERQLREQAKEKAEAIKRAQRANGPRPDEDPVAYACRLEAEAQIAEERAAREVPMSITDARIATSPAARAAMATGTSGGSDREIREQLAAEMREMRGRLGIPDSGGSSTPPRDLYRAVARHTGHYGRR